MGLTQSEMAARMGLSRSYVHQLEVSKRTPSDSVETLVRMLESQVASGLIEDPPSGSVVREDTPKYGNNRFRAVPVVGWAHAGDAQSYEEIPKGWQCEVGTDCRDEKAFAVRLEGCSMAEQFQPGDILILQPSLEPHSGCLAVCKFTNDGLVFRRVEFYPDLVRLVALNPDYPPLEYPRSEFAWIYPVFARITQIWQR